METFEFAEPERGGGDFFGAGEAGVRQLHLEAELPVGLEAAKFGGGATNDGVGARSGAVDTFLRGVVGFVLFLFGEAMQPPCGEDDFVGEDLFEDGLGDEFLGQAVTELFERLWAEVCWVHFVYFPELGWN